MTRLLRPTGAWRCDAFAHEAFLFDTDEQFVQRSVPFVDEGISTGQPVAVVLSQRVLSVLTEALGPLRGHLVVFPPAEAWWRGGHATLETYERTVRAPMSRGEPWRLIGEPVWLGTAEGRVWTRYEAVINRCYADIPCYHICAQDLRRLDQAVVQQVLRTHPLVWNGVEPVASPDYEDPEQFLRSVEPSWVERPSTASTATVVTARDARRVVAAAAGLAGLAGRTDDVVLATSEVVTNALQVASPAQLATWTTPDALVVEVVDRGPGLRDVTAGYIPPGAAPENGRGLWIARGLADDSALRSDGGTTVRLVFRRSLMPGDERPA